MTEPAEVENDLPTENEKNVFKLNSDKLASLKKARQERSKKIRELNEKELNLVHSLDNIYSTLGTIETRLNHLDGAVRNYVVGSKRSYEDQLIEEDAKKLKTEKVKNVENEIDEESFKSDNSFDWDSVGNTFISGGGLLLCFVATRFIQSYLDRHISNTDDSGHKINTSHDYY